MFLDVRWTHCLEINLTLAVGSIELRKAVLSGVLLSGVRDIENRDVIFNMG